MITVRKISPLCGHNSSVFSTIRSYIMMENFAMIIATVMLEFFGRCCLALTDLSHSLNGDTLNWTPVERFALTDQVMVDNPPTFYATNSFMAPEHCGTHLDAPYHFNKYGWKVDEITLNHLVCPGVHVNVSVEVGKNGDFELLPEHLEKWERINGRIPKGVILLVNFGWSKRYGERVSYYGNITAPYKFSGISVAAARWITSHGGIYGVGLDTPSLDPGYSDTYPAHNLILKANIFGLENLALDGVHIPPTGFKVIALPLKITGGTGSPCRVVLDNL